MDAWARLFLRHPYATPVFITASAEVIDLLRKGIRHAPDHPFGGAADPTAADLMSRLEILASGRAPAAEPLFENGESVHPRTSRAQRSFISCPIFLPYGYSPDWQHRVAGD